MAKLGKPVIQSTATYSLQLAVSLGLVIVVSRLLAPAEIGAYLIASAVMILVLPLRDFQIQSYVLQRKNVEREHLAPVAWVAWASALGSVLIVMIASTLFGVTYPDAPIAACLLIMGISLAIRPLGLLPMALLARDLRYGTIAWIQLSGAAVKVLVTLGLIAIGHGAEALAWGYVAELAVETSAVFAVKKGVRFVPPSIAGSREVMQFAAPFTGANLVLTISMAAIPIIIGGYLGLAASAFFNRARTVSQFFRSSVEGAVHQIVLQRFAQKREDLAAQRSDYLKSISLLTAISWPSLIWLFLLAEPLTLLLFGEQWAATAPLTKGLAVAGVLYSVTAFSRQLHAAMEDTSLLFRRDAWLQLPLLLAVVLAAQLSVLAVAQAIAAVAVLALGVHVLLLRQRLHVRIGDTFSSLRASAMVAILVGVAVFLTQEWLGPIQSNLVSTLTTAGGAACAWVISLLLTRHPLLSEILNFVGEWRDARASNQAD